MKIMNRSGDPLAEHQLLELLAAEGIAFLSETDCDEIVEAFHGMLEIYRHPDAADTAWTVIQPRPENRHSPGSDGFTHASLGPHTDRSMLDAPPSVLCFLMLTEAVEGGDSVLIDTKPLLSRYGRESLRYIENDLWIHSRVQGWWQRVLTTSHDGYTIIRFRDDDVARPVNSSRLSESLVCGLRNARDGVFRFRLRAGEGYVIHNHRVLHGRTFFEGHRKGARLLFHVRGNSPYRYLNEGFLTDLQDSERKSGS